MKGKERDLIVKTKQEINRNSINITDMGTILGTVVLKQNIKYIFSLVTIILMSQALVLTTNKVFIASVYVLLILKDFRKLLIVETALTQV